jgi:hypothetical protein
VQKPIIVSLILCLLSAAGCANHGQFGENIVTDTSRVSITRGANMTHESVYEDPLYYNNNAFDSLYFN